MVNHAQGAQARLNWSIPVSANQLIARMQGLAQSFLRRDGMSRMTSLHLKGTFMRTISSFIGAAAAMLILLSAGCASGPTVRADKDPSINLRAYKTFWQGVAEGRVDTQAGNDPGAAIEAAVAEIFAVFPDGKGK